LATQSVTQHTPAYPLNFFMFGASSLTLLGVVAFANGVTITCEPRLDQGQVGSTEGDLLGGRVNSASDFP